MNPKFARMIVKLAVMGVGSVLIGTIVKAEKKLGDRIDAHYAPEPEAEQQDN